MTEYADDDDSRWWCRAGADKSPGAQDAGRDKAVGAFRDLESGADGEPAYLREVRPQQEVGSSSSKVESAPHVVPADLREDCPQREV